MPIDKDAMALKVFANVIFLFNFVINHEHLLEKEKQQNPNVIVSFEAAE